jgi:hypothetical protein
MNIRDRARGNRGQAAPLLQHRVVSLINYQSADGTADKPTYEPSGT